VRNLTSGVVSKADFSTAAGAKRTELGPAGEKCPSGHDERDDAIAGVADAVAGHRLNDRPFLPKQGRRLVDVPGVHLDATRPPTAVARDLKEEGVADRFPIVTHRRSFLSHSVSPLICVKLKQIAFLILIFVRRDCDAEKLLRSVANI
jgi:hypothetical protein